MVVLMPAMVMLMLVVMLMVIVVLVMVMAVVMVMVVMDERTGTPERGGKRNVAKTHVIYYTSDASHTEGQSRQVADGQ
eukprot:4928163-Lingulodinium_polyedra.AAC.1